MKRLTWRPNGNHIVINTGHKTFDRQADCLSVGNVWGDVQLSSYIRPKTETECNGFSNPPGHLRDFDLKQFKDLPQNIRRKIVNITDTRYCILYEIRTWGKRGGWDGRRRKTIHGYILTDAKTHELVEKWATGPTHKSWMIIENVIPYLTNP